MGLATSKLSIHSRCFKFLWYIRSDPKYFFLFFKILIRCWDTRVQIYPTSARKIFGVVKKWKVPAEKCSNRSIKKVICLKEKHWSKRWVVGTSNRCPDHLSRHFLTTASTFPYSFKNSSAEHIHTFLYISLCAWVWVRERECVSVNAWAWVRGRECECESANAGVRVRECECVNASAWVRVRECGCVSAGAWVRGCVLFVYVSEFICDCETFK